MSSQQSEEASVKKWDKQLVVAESDASLPIHAVGDDRFSKKGLALKLMR
jgi:hypothetical protein